MTEQSKQAEIRDRELARRGRRSTHPPLGSPFDMKLVGVVHVPGYPQLFHDIAGLMEGGPIMWVTLHREPDNEYDTNAIRAEWDGHKLGMFTRPIALRLAPELDAGTTWLAYIKRIPITEDSPDQPGIIVRCKREE